jgi:hypothetical protein
MEMMWMRIELMWYKYSMKMTWMRIELMWYKHSMEMSDVDED